MAGRSSSARLGSGLVWEVARASEPTAWQGGSGQLGAGLGYGGDDMDMWCMRHGTVGKIKGARRGMVSGAQG